MDNRIEQAARLAHEVNRAYCEATGDKSQKPWGEAEQWQRQSAINGVHLALTGATPQQQHEGWMRDKIADGWSFGAQKNVDAKTHPCLVEYDDLPDAQKVKDYLYGAVIRAVFA